MARGPIWSAAMSGAEEKPYIDVKVYVRGAPEEWSAQQERAFLNAWAANVIEEYHKGDWVVHLARALIRDA